MRDHRESQGREGIESLIRRKENYTYKYWSVWIMFLGLVAGILAMQAWRNLNLDATFRHAGRQCVTDDTSSYAEANAYADMMKKTMAEQAYMIKVQTAARM